MKRFKYIAILVVILLTNSFSVFLGIFCKDYIYEKSALKFNNLKIIYRNDDIIKSESAVYEQMKMIFIIPKIDYYLDNDYKIESIYIYARKVKLLICKGDINNAIGYNGVLNNHIMDLAMTDDQQCLYSIKLKIFQTLEKEDGLNSKWMKKCNFHYDEDIETMLRTYHEK